MTLKDLYELNESVFSHTQREKERDREREKERE
jgi:hypothetical protein